MAACRARGGGSVLMVMPSHPMPEIRTFAATDFDVPEELGRLRELAYNFWWSWSPEARMLFSSIHPELWTRYRNPVEVLLNVDPQHWESLLLSDSFQAAFDNVMSAYDRYMSHPERWWFNERQPGYEGGPVAYLSTEFGIHESLGIYSGGLGVLSGDHCKAASDQGIPFVAVGLLYRRGYFRQTINAEGRQQHFYPDFDISRLPVLPVLDPQGRPLEVSVPLLDRKVWVRAYKAQVGRVPVLLLDTDVPKNEMQDRPITHILYVRGREMRLCQEMVLGIGAVRVLRALGIEPAVWHMNEGHVAFMLLERLREATQRGERMPRALETVRRNVAFTTHTPVPAGNETFDGELARLYLGSWAVQLGVPVADLLRLGRVEPDNEGEPFNLTAFALRGSSFRNAVSRKHCDVSRAMWKPVFPDETEVPISSITNGIHVETWVGLELRDLFERRIGVDWERAAQDPDRWHGFMETVPAEEVWEAHKAQKRRLIRKARDVVRRMLARQGSGPRDLAAAGHMLDPGALTIGFARRFATYKRAGLLFRDLGRLRKLLSDPDRPLQIVFAGKAHPADLAGQDLIAQIFRLSQSEPFLGKIVFLEDYDMQIGRVMVQGVDVWLNTPQRPLEASGTSGQKAAANGGLNLSVLDGWWIEGYSPDVGWAIGRLDPLDDPETQSAEDAAALYDILEREVIPMFYERERPDAPPMLWVEKMKHSIHDLLPVFSGSRMVRDYAEQAYLPLATGKKLKPTQP
jgi:starch phosphorylase